MCISSIGPWSVILCQTMYSKVRIEMWCLNNTINKSKPTRADRKINENAFLAYFKQFWYFSRRCKSTEVDRRTWLHVPSRAKSTSSYNHLLVKIQERISLIAYIHHLKPDGMNNMQHTSKRILVLNSHQRSSAKLYSKLNFHQRSLAKQGKVKIKSWCLNNTKAKMKQRGGVKFHKLTF